MAAGTHTIAVTTTVAAEADTIFALLIDLPGYSTWLPQSTAYKGTTEISDNPIKVGSQYIERRTSVTETRRRSRVISYAK